jgi:hypothetical protein
MEKHLFQIMNIGGLGPDEHAALQRVDGYDRYEFSQIKYVNQDGNIREVSITDADLSNDDIIYILENQAHRVDISFDENQNITLYF